MDHPYSDYLTKQDKLRRKALFERDASGYARLCDICGFEPEDPELYDQWEADSLWPEVERRIRLSEFLGKAGKLSPKLSSDPKSKKALLAKYFPDRFGESGKQDLKDYRPAEIGALFYKVTLFYKKQLGK